MEIVKVYTKKDYLRILALTAFMLSIALIAKLGITFNINAVAPNISAAAAITGLTKAYRAYKAGQGVRKAIALVFGWNVVGLLVSVLGDLAIGYLLENHITTLAHW